MQIKATGKEFVLYRYGGVADGKALQVRVASVPLNALPNAIPAHVVENLTPSELRELQGALRKQQAVLSRELATKLSTDLAGLAAGLDIDSLDDEDAARLLDAATQMSSALRRVQRARSALAAAATTPEAHIGAIHLDTAGDCAD